MSENFQQQKQPLALVVDDEASQRILLENTLIQAGLSAKLAENGEEALDLFNSYSFDIVLMDIDMPVMDGLEACSKIRSLPQGKDIPIVLITGLDDHESITKAFELDATDFITKPVNWPILVHRIRYLIKASDTLDSLVKSETRLRESEQRYRQISSISSDWVWEMDENLRINYLSDGLYNISRRAASFALGKTRQQLVTEAELSKPYWKKHLSDLECKREFRDFQYEFIDPDGNILNYQISGAPVFDQNGHFQGYRGTGSNVTERVKAAQTLKIAKEDAEYANKAKSQFLSSMSHELRTPLNAIIGFSQLLEMEEDPPLTETQFDYVSEIIKAGDYLLKLINEVLDLAKIEADRIDLSIEAVEYGVVIGESLQLITPLAEKHGIDITLTMNGNAISLEQLIQQEAVINVDHTRLKQVLINLMSNAVKYNSENGSIIIACENIENSQIRISITDTGAGLTQQEQNQLFQAFNRLNPEHSNIEGTGIGLVISKKLVELMGGHLNVESYPGQGSTFSLEFSNECQNDAIKETIEENKTALSPPSLTHHDIQHKILCIEDNPANLRLISELLNYRPNIQMLSTHDPSLGLELAIKHKPGLILLDINLPGMNGFELLKKLRQREDTVDTKVIAVSANAMPDDIERGLQSGFDNYITKPIDVNVLLHDIDMTFSNNSK